MGDRPTNEKIKVDGPNDALHTQNCKLKTPQSADGNFPQPKQLIAPPPPGKKAKL